MRFKDVNWNCGDGPQVRDVEHAKLAVLMDIRDELKESNRIARRVEKTVERIDRRVRKHMPLK